MSTIWSVIALSLIRLSSLNKFNSVFSYVQNKTYVLYTWSKVQMFLERSTNNFSWAPYFRILQANHLTP